MRIQELDQITNEAMDLSQFIPLDDPGQTFKATLLQLSDFLQANILNRVFNVGSTLYRVDNRTPNEAGFPGVWAKASAEATLATGKADGTDTGSYTGNNTPAVPLPSHTHTADQPSHTHTATQAAHGHTITVDSNGAHTHTVNARLRGDFVTGSVTGAQGPGAAEHHTDTNVYPTAASAGAHAHTATASSTTPAITVASADAAITVAATGVASPTLDVRGYHINGQLWIRTA